jgi:hypothetical protein
VRNRAVVSPDGIRILDGHAAPLIQRSPKKERMARMTTISPMR